MKETSDASGVSLTPPAAAALSAAAVTAMVAKKAQPTSAPDNHLSAAAKVLPLAAAVSHVVSPAVKHGAKPQRLAIFRTPASCASVFGGSLASAASHTTAKEETQKFSAPHISASAVPAPSIFAPSPRASSVLAQSASALRQFATPMSSQQSSQRHFCSSRTTTRKPNTCNSLPSLFRFATLPVALLFFFVFGFFTLLANAEGVNIVTKTELHSANWIWCDQKPEKEYDEYSEGMILGKKKYPKDLARKTIGVGEIINLKVTGEAVLDSTCPVLWGIVEGDEWAELISNAGTEIQLGAKVKNGDASRTVVVEASVSGRTQTVTITILKPNGTIKSRHGAPMSATAYIPTTDQFPDNSPPKIDGMTIPSGGHLESGAWTKLVMIFLPATVNFGGSFDGGVYILEQDISSPPIAGTYSPSLEDAFANPPAISIYSNGHHDVNGTPLKIEETIAGLMDVLFQVKWGYLETYFRLQTCDWTCRFHWTDSAGGIIDSFPDVVQHFETTASRETTISKFNSSVTREASATTQSRDTANDWTP